MAEVALDAVDRPPLQPAAEQLVVGSQLVLWNSRGSLTGMILHRALQLQLQILLCLIRKRILRVRLQISNIGDAGS